MKLIGIKRVFSKAEATKGLIFVYLFLLSTTFNFLNLDGRNILFLSITVLIAMALVILWHNQLPNPLKSTVFLLLLYLPFSYLINIKNGSITSLLYSFFFLISYLLIVPFSIRHFTRTDLLVCIRFLVFAFFIVTLVGHLYVALGFFNPNAGAFGGHGLFGTVFSKESGSMRYYSLSTEPSYASIIVVFLYYLFQKNAKRLYDNRYRSLMFFATAYMVVSFNSGFGYLLFAILLWINLKNQHPAYAVLSFVALLILSIAIFMVDVDIYAIKRIKNIVTQFDFSDWTSIVGIDHSASFRIMPFYFYATSMDIFSLEFYLGAGVAASDHFLNVYLFPNIADSDIYFQAGLLPGFLIAYGVFGFILIFISYLYETKSLFSFGSVVMLMVIINANLNTQLFWIAFTFLTLDNRLQKKGSVL